MIKIEDPRQRSYSTAFLNCWVRRLIAGDESGLVGMPPGVHFVFAFSAGRKISIIFQADRPMKRRFNHKEQKSYALFSEMPAKSVRIEVTVRYRSMVNAVMDASMTRPSYGIQIRISAVRRD